MRKILSTLLCATAFAAAADRRAPGFSLVDNRAVEHDLADYRERSIKIGLTRRHTAFDFGDGGMYRNEPFIGNGGVAAYSFERRMRFR